MLYLSQDEVGITEWNEGKDLHEENRVRFGLPERRIAKVFLFRLIYGGTEWSYANDPQFRHISKSPDFWKDVIDEFYDKYQGIFAYHERIMREVPKRGYIRLPTGRQYDFKPVEKGRRGAEWPRTCILNYPVQGLAAELTAIARVSIHRRLSDAGITGILCNTVHDSIVADCPDIIIPDVARILDASMKDVSKNFEMMFGIPFNVVVKGEIEIGKNWLDMEEYKLVA